MLLDERTISVKIDREQWDRLDDEDLEKIAAAVDEILTVEIANMCQMVERRMGQYVKVTSD